LRSLNPVARAREDTVEVMRIHKRQAAIRMTVLAVTLGLGRSGVAATITVNDLSDPPPGVGTTCTLRRFGNRWSRVRVAALGCGLTQFDLH
jgi:hypothetical protein